MKVIRRVTPAVVAVALLWSATRSAVAQVLDQVPAGSLLVVKINDIKPTFDKLAALNKRLGLAEVSPEMADPLGNIQRESGMEKGIDLAGDAAFAYIDPAVSGVEDEDQSMIILIPVTDYQAFLSNFANPQQEQGQTKITFRDGEPAYVANWGSYAAISPAATVLSKQPEGVKISGVAAKELDGKDVVLLANMSALRKTLLPALQNNRQNILQDIEQQMANQQAEGDEEAVDPELAKKATPVVKAVVNQGLNVAEAFLRDAQAATYGLSITDQGLQGTLLAEFEAGSYLGQVVSQLKPGNQPLLGGLPAGKYLVFGGMSTDSPVFQKVFNDLIDPVLKELPALGDQQAQVINKVVEDYRKALAATKTTSFGLVAPTGALGQAPILQGISVMKGDAEAIKASSQSMFENQQELMNVFNMNAGQVKTTYTANAKTVDGVSFDRFQSQMNMNPQNAQEMQMAQMMAFMYGPNGMTGHIGVIDSQTVLSVFGVSDQTTSQAISAAKANRNVLSTQANVQQVAQQLPQQRLAEVYVPLDVILGTGLNYARQFGMAIPAQLPNDLPPIGIAVATEGTALRVDSHVPTQLVEAIVAAGMQAYGAMQGGGMGPGAGPGGEAPDDGGL